MITTITLSLAGLDVPSPFPKMQITKMIKNSKRKRKSSERLERNERICEMKWERMRKRNGQIREQMIGCWERDPSAVSRK